MVNEETGVEVGAQMWLERRGDVTSIKSPWLGNCVEPASAHWFSVKSVTNLAISYISQQNKSRKNTLLSELICYSGLYYNLDFIPSFLVILLLVASVNTTGNR